MVTHVTLWDDPKVRLSWSNKSLGRRTTEVLWKRTFSIIDLSEVEITCGHRSISVHIAIVTKQNYMWLVGVPGRACVTAAAK